MSKRILIAVAAFAVACIIGSKASAAEPTKNNAAEFQHATAAYNNGRFTQAIQQYKNSAEEHNGQAILDLAVIFKDLGYYDQAINVLPRSSQDARVLSLLGRIFYLNHQPEEAIAVLKKVLSISSNDIEAKITLGLLFKELQMDEEAKKYFNQALAQNSNNVIARLSLADLYYQRKKLSAAVSEYQAVSLLDASMVGIQKVIGEISFLMGNFEEAYRAYQKVQATEAKNPFVTQRIKEISARLGKEYFQKEREKTLSKRAQKSVRVEPFPEVKNIAHVRIGIVRKEPSIGLKCSVPFEMHTKFSQARVLGGSANESFRLALNPQGKLVLYGFNAESLVVDEPLIITPLAKQGTISVFNVKFGGDNYWSGRQDRSYRGEFEISVEDQSKGLKIVNIVNLEEYLYGVVPSEMPAQWPKEALKAQAVAARSEIMAKLGRHKSEGFDFCAEVHCQVYSGVEVETFATNTAVDETRGVIMVSRGKPIDAIYSSNCGGHTQDNIFGECKSIPYLKAKADSSGRLGLVFPLGPYAFEQWLKNPPAGIFCDLSGEAKSSNFRWVRIYSAHEMNELLKKIADFGEIKKILVLKRQRSGHISALKIVGSKQSYVLEKELNIRKALGNLRSSMCKVEVKYSAQKAPEQFIFFGGGWGHGVGMCQSGASGMASLGKPYKEILGHYYSDVEFKNIY